MINSHHTAALLGGVSLSGGHGAPLGIAAGAISLSLGWSSRPATRAGGR